ncbi:hypothetical protein [Sorangium sp. So ce1153]|uniref:hypothetical protein n=1 Tax=Sorangium sp. So ce1153 TaxID=3133333 RepID=UPI003F62E479
MISPQDFLAVARDLAKLDSRRPRQASLRRAVSTAYYALFHLLIRSSVSAQVGFGPTTTHREIGETVVRWFTHTRMAEVCGLFAGPTVPSKLRKVLPKGPQGAASVAASAALQGVARAFLDLQQARHDADYDPSKRFTRQGVLTHVGQAEQAFKDWDVAISDPFRPVFLLLMLTGDAVIKDR